MGIFTKLVLLAFTSLVVFIGIKINSLFEVPSLPKLEETYWGPGKPAKDDISIKPFKINVPEEVITDLKIRLDQARPFTPPLEGIQQQYGINTNLLNEIIEFWKTKYNTRFHLNFLSLLNENVYWREREQFLNKYPQFKTNIQGLQIHYLHVKPSSAAGLKVLPLLLLHGWPGSVREFYKIIPLLTTPQKGRDFVLELIIPSLPGYGFSQGASKPGLGAAQMAVVLKNLMKRLGFEKYYLQGGDWGAIIAANMATLYPEHVLGLHSNMCIGNSQLATLKLILGSFWPSLVVEKEYQDKMYPLSDIFSHFMLEMGYLHIQATKPDTVGVALNDSPVGLAAYIIEKFITWTNKEWKDKADGGLKLKYTYTDLLDNVMIYWVTKSMTTSVRLYAEAINKAQMGMQLDRIPIEVPSACAKFPHEIRYHSDFILKDKYKQLVQSNDFPSGGHFAAFEQPEILAKDVWTAVQKFQEVHHAKVKKF